MLPLDARSVHTLRDEGHGLSGSDGGTLGMLAPSPLGSITIGRFKGVPGKRTPSIRFNFWNFRSFSIWIKMYINETDIGDVITLCFPILKCLHQFSCSLAKNKARQVWSMIGTAVWEILDPPLDLISRIILIFVQNKIDREVTSKHGRVANLQFGQIFLCCSGHLSCNSCLHHTWPPATHPLPCMPPCHALPLPSPLPHMSPFATHTLLPMWTESQTVVKTLPCGR